MTPHAMTPQAVPPRHRAPAGDIPVLDWQGRALDCSTCPHQALLHQGGCEPGHSCMQDAYARRIDRFFHQHPGLAGGHLAHPYFEVRAIAARHADLFHLNALRHDPDETVRMQVALRLPQRLLATMADDPHREVRIRVAQRLAETDLGRLLHDPDEAVRGVVARRLPLALLPTLAHDPDEEVRRIVAQRLQMPALWRLADDPAPRVRRLVAERAPQPLLHHLATDADWSVRWEVAQRLCPQAQGDTLRRLAEDPDPEVRAMAAERLAASPGLPETVLMADINRDDDVLEISLPPRFQMGERVACRSVVRNDGTYNGKDIGEVLVNRGDIGYVRSIGTFLQQFYIYAVEFVDSGHQVGMRAKELCTLDHLPDEVLAQLGERAGQLREMR